MGGDHGWPDSISARFWLGFTPVLAGQRRQRLGALRLCESPLQRCEARSLTALCIETIHRFRARAGAMTGRGRVLEPRSDTKAGPWRLSFGPKGLIRRDCGRAGTSAGPAPLATHHHHHPNPVRSQATERLLRTQHATSRGGHHRDRMHPCRAIATQATR